MQKRRNFIANALELRLFCIKPSIKTMMEKRRFTIYKGVSLISEITLYGVMLANSLTETRYPHKLVRDTATKSNQVKIKYFVLHIRYI